MSLKKDLFALVNDRGRSNSIHASLFEKDVTRRKVYDVLSQLARECDLGVVGLALLLWKYEDARHSLRRGESARESHDGPFELPLRLFFDTLVSCRDLHAIQSRGDLETLLMEIRLLGLKELPIDSPAVTYIEQQRRATMEQLPAIDAALIRKYRNRKHQWLQQNLQLKGYQSTLGRQRRESEAVHCRYMNLMGREHLACQAQRDRLAAARRILGLLRDNPGYGRIDCERMLRQDEQRATVHSRNHFAPLPGCALKSADDDDQTCKAGDEAKLCLRRLASLTHSDRILRLDPGCRQRRQLEEIWEELAAIRELQSDRRKLAAYLPYLEEKLAQARRIHDMAHIRDLDATLVIPGAEIEEQLAWLGQASLSLERRISLLRASNLQISSNEQIERMRQVVEAPVEVQESERRALREETEQLCMQADVIQKQADVLLQDRLQ